ncbi:hypothetical protein BT69DRAFT_1305501 [Atractiella rhizophila]|nr:hypothetical protein BT69DRAFT_1305501 [Atractiella rhizophila]
MFDWLLVPGLFLLAFPQDILDVIDSFVCGCQLVWQHQSTEEERLEIQDHFVAFIIDWEKIYILYSQSPMERMIGYLKKHINQGDKYQENLLNQAVLQEQLNILILIQAYCAAHGKNLNGIDMEKTVAKWEHWGVDNTGDCFYGEAIGYIRIPETFFNPTANVADDKLFAVTQLFSKRTNLFNVSPRTPLNNPFTCSLIFFKSALLICIIVLPFVNYNFGN